MPSARSNAEPLAAYGYPAQPQAMPGMRLPHAATMPRPRSNAEPPPLSPMAMAMAYGYPAQPQAMPGMRLPHAATMPRASSSALPPPPSLAAAPGWPAQPQAVPGVPSPHAATLPRVSASTPVYAPCGMPAAAGYFPGYPRY